MEQKVCPSCNASNTASAFYCAVCQTQINGSEVKENETFEYNRSDKSYM